MALSAARVLRCCCGSRATVARLLVRRASNQQRRNTRQEEPATTKHSRGALPQPPGPRRRRMRHTVCGAIAPRGCSSMAEHQLPKLTVRVRFSSPAQREGPSMLWGSFSLIAAGTARIGSPGAGGGGRLSSPAPTTLCTDSVRDLGTKLARVAPLRSPCPPPPAGERQPRHHGASSGPGNAVRAPRISPDSMSTRRPRPRGGPRQGRPRTRAIQPAPGISTSRCVRTIADLQPRDSLTR